MQATSIDLNLLSEDKRNEAIELLHTLEKRRQFYGILGVKPQPHQQELLDVIAETTKVQFIGRPEVVPRYKYILYQGGNGSGKTFSGMYAVVCLALGRDTEKYGLPYLGEKKNIWVVTKSGANVQSTIGPYLVGVGSNASIPRDAVRRITKDNGVIKTIELNNGSVITIRTYDQGYERLQGGNPDFILVDEEPTDRAVWNELVARTRGQRSQLVLTMTPLSGLTPVYEYFYEQDSEAIMNASKIVRVNSLQNIYADNSGLLGLTPEERLMRISGEFVSPEGIVYNHFSPDRNGVVGISPKDLGPGVVYYGALDFGHTHPTAFLFICADQDGNLFVFDMIYEAGLLIDELYEKIMEKKRKWGIEFEYIIGDSAAKRERRELAAKGLRTIPADKYSRGEGDMSNRNTGINKVNTLFQNSKIFIDLEKCTDLVKELQSHHYKKGNKRDGEVVKTGDDAVDALRYFVFSYKSPGIDSLDKKRFKEKTGVSLAGAKKLKKNYNNPY